MGQYYIPAILKKDKKTVEKWMYSHDYNNGLKLMEHSYIGNNFVSAFESLIKNNPQPMVWGGDYAEPCKGLKTNIFKRCDAKPELKAMPTVYPTKKETRYIVNHTTKQFVDKTKIISKDGWGVHPLPLLTCEGNGQGGGDYYLENPFIGIWARNTISVESKKPKDYTEITPNFLLD